MEEQTRRKRRSALFGQLAIDLGDEQAQAPARQEKRREVAEVAFKAYLVWVEPEGEAYFTPEAVCIIYPDKVYRVFSLDTRHNFLRSAILKHKLDDLLGDGLLYRNSTLRLEDLEPVRTRKNLNDTGAIPLLQAIYQDNPSTYHFLTRFVK